MKQCQDCTWLLCCKGVGSVLLYTYVPLLYPLHTRGETQEPYDSGGLLRAGKNRLH